MTQTQVFSCEYCEIFKNTYFEEHLRTVASLKTHLNNKNILDKPFTGKRFYFLVTLSLVLGGHLLLLLISHFFLGFSATLNRFSRHDTIQMDLTEFSFVIDLQRLHGFQTLSFS